MHIPFLTTHDRGTQLCCTFTQRSSKKQQRGGGCEGEGRAHACFGHPRHVVIRAQGAALLLLRMQRAK